jgi:acyl dehydratase
MSRQSRKVKQVRYFEDFQVGDTFDLGSLIVTEEEIISFAKQFDPQYFHIDAQRAKDSVFGGLVASGMHTLSLFMRLLVDSLLMQTDSVASPGLDEVRWLRPLYPNDTLYGRLTIIDAKASRSRPTLGILRSHSELFNQRNELLMTVIGIHFVGRKPAEGSR